MNKRNLQNDDLDRIGMKLVAQDAISEHDIDKILSSPFLYSTVRNRILADAATSSGTIGLTRYLVLVGSSLVVVFGLFAAVSYVRIQQQTIANVPQPKVVEIVRSNIPDGYSTKQGAELPAEPLVEKVNTRRRISQQSQTIVHRKPVRQSTPSKQAAIEFHPIAFIDDANDISGGRVVRVELSRQTLFAMGANIPLENGVETVMADLLIGPDGVTRAIRLAKDF